MGLCVLEIACLVFSSSERVPRLVLFGLPTSAHYHLYGGNNNSETGVRGVGMYFELRHADMELGTIYTYSMAHQSEFGYIRISQ